MRQLQLARANKSRLTFWPNIESAAAAKHLSQSGQCLVEPGATSQRRLNRNQVDLPLHRPYAATGLCWPAANTYLPDVDISIVVAATCPNRHASTAASDAEQLSLANF